jgi:hypothetical protein
MTLEAWNGLISLILIVGILSYLYSVNRRMR